MKIDISIILCTYNRCESLEEALRSILKNQGTCNYEIIAVDNNSTDHTRKLVENYRERFSDRMRYCFEPKQGINFARNRGLQEARGDIVVYTDDDVVVSDNWISSISTFFAEYPDADAVGGKILPVYPEKSPAWVKKYQNLLKGPILAHDCGEATMVYNQKTMHHFVGANMAFRKKVFAETGGFRTDVGVGTGTMGAETEFFSRLMKHHKKVYYCGKIFLWHPVTRDRMTLGYITRWNIRLGRYRFLVDENGRTDPALIHYFGVPRYLYLNVFLQGVFLVGTIFHHGEFLKRWIILAQTIGKIQAIRKYHLHKRTAARKDA